MASTKEIQNRIKSIKDTMKITNAMYMISSSKLKKAKQSMEDTEPYFYTLQVSLGRFLSHVPEMQHLYFDSRTDIPDDKKKKGFIVVTADKGMCGAYNHNVIKLAEAEIAKHENTELYVVGQIGMHYFERKNVSIDEAFHYTAQNPSMHRARVIADSMIENFESGDVDEVYIIYTKMINNVASATEVRQLLPLQKENFNGFKSRKGEVGRDDITLYPSAEAVLDRIVPNYITGFIYGALVESFASEQNARMMAMDTATTSAKKMLEELNIKYNRARQANITQEITEVVGGARAQQNKS